MFLKKVEEGIKGLNIGTKTLLKKLSYYTNNIQDEETHLIGAQQKTGKTSFIIFFYIVGPYLLNQIFRVLFFSFEMPIHKLISKTVSMLAYLKYNTIIPDEVIFSKGDHKLSEEKFKLVKKIYEEDIIYLFGEYNEDGFQTKKGIIEIITKRINPTGLRKVYKTYLLKYGKLSKKVVEVEVNGKMEKKEILGNFILNNPKEKHFIIFDHIGLIPKERGFSTKENIDKMSEYILEDRNTYKCTWVIISQFNRGLSSVDRLKFSAEQLTPTSADFKDTGNLAQDADLILALFNPGQYNHIRNHMGYNLDELPDDSYRSVHILENRNGPGFLSEGLFFRGACGVFSELESPDTIDYSRYKK